MNIYLIRHGQTDWNLQGRIQGRKDISLNDTGRQQAERLAVGMDSRPVSRIYSSALKRAMETAAVIGSRQGVDVLVVKGLEEVDFGRWEGLTMEEIMDRYPDEYARWCANPVEVAPPGGETLNEVIKRCAGVVEGILARAAGDIAMISHGAALAHIAAYLLRDCGDDAEIIVENASITTIFRDPLTGEFSLVGANDTRHLCE